MRKIINQLSGQRFEWEPAAKSSKPNGRELGGFLGFPSFNMGIR